MSLVERRATAYGVSHPNLPGVFVICIFQILEALHQLHDRDVVHGNLQPSCIVWSSTDFCWKLLDLEFAAKVGDSIPLRGRVATRYMAPEVQQAFKKNQDSVKASISMDIWSFDLIKSEITTGTLVFIFISLFSILDFSLQECLHQTLHYGKPTSLNDAMD